MLEQRKADLTKRFEELTEGSQEIKVKFEFLGKEIETSINIEWHWETEDSGYCWVRLGDGDSLEPEDNEEFRNVRSSV